MGRIWLVDKQGATSWKRCLLPVPHAVCHRQVFAAPANRRVQLAVKLQGAEFIWLPLIAIAPVSAMAAMLALFPYGAAAVLSMHLASQE